MIEQIDAALTVAYQRGDELGLGPFALGVVRLNEISSSALCTLKINIPGSTCSSQIRTW